MEKSPDLQVLLDQLKAERSELQDKTLPLRAERDRLLNQIQPIQDRIRKLEKEYTSIERPRLAELDIQIAKLSVALGAKKMSDGPSTSTTGT